MPPKSSKYRCLDCGYVATSAKNGICPACHSSLMRRDLSEPLESAPVKSSAWRLWVCWLLWAAFALLLVDKIAHLDWF